VRLVSKSWLISAASLVTLLAISPCFVWAADLFVGTATTSITPDKPVALHGQWDLRMSQGVETPITATALALQGREGEKALDQAIFVACDLAFIPSDVLKQVRSRIQPELPDFDPQKLLINATHTHTAPVLEEGVYPIPADGVLQPKEYAAFLVERLSDVIVRAWKNRQSGAAGWGLGHAVLGQNRRAVYADGTAAMYGNTARPDFRRIEGYEDHGVEVLFFWNRQKELQAVAVNVACTAQEVESLSVIHADFWHPVRERLRQRYGPALNVLGWIGAAGDQSPHLMYRMAAEERMRQLRGLSRLDEIANRISAAVDEAYEGAAKDIHADPLLIHEVQTVRLPAREVTEAELQAAKKAVDRAVKEEQKGSRTTHKAWFGSIIDRYETQKTDPWYDAEIHVLRLGDIAICTNPFELFLDYGVQMKARSKALQTFVIQLTGRGMYLPTEQAVHGGSYSAEILSNLVGPAGGQILTDRTVEMINAMWPAADKSTK
jgi:hypothetical protein